MAALTSKSTTINPMDRTEIITERDRIISEDGPWIANLSLGGGLCTRPGEPLVASQRMVKLLQATGDLVSRPLSDLRVLDLGTQEGVHGIEFARRGARVVTIEGRKKNYRKLDFATRAIGLSNIQNILGDINSILFDSDLGEFDVIICSGILYHLPLRSQPRILSYIFDKAKDLVVVDSHFSLENNSTFEYLGKNYFGSAATEFEGVPSADVVEDSVYKSLTIEPSFQISRESFVNFMMNKGCRSVYEMFLPARSPSREPALVNRCCFVCVKGRCETHEGNFAPAEEYVEGDLSYFSPRTTVMAQKYANSLANRAAVFARKVLGKRRVGD